MRQLFIVQKSLQGMGSNDYMISYGCSISGNKEISSSQFPFGLRNMQLDTLNAILLCGVSNLLGIPNEFGFPPVGVPIMVAIPLSLRVTAKVRALLNVWQETLQYKFEGKQVGYLLFLTISCLFVIYFGLPVA